MALKFVCVLLGLQDVSFDCLSTPLVLTEDLEGVTCFKSGLLGFLREVLLVPSEPELLSEPRDFPLWSASESLELLFWRLLSDV